MKFGLSLINRGALARPETMTRFVQRAEALGFDWVSISDHIVIPKAMPDNYPYHPDGQFAWQSARDYYEPLATLMFLAGRTTRLRLGTSVLIIPYRNPVIVAKMVATIDALSGLRYAFRRTRVPGHRHGLVGGRVQGARAARSLRGAGAAHGRVYPHLPQSVERARAALRGPFRPLREP